MESNIVIGYLSAIIVIFIFAKIFIIPIKWILRLIVNSIVGIILLWIINLMSANYNFVIGINFFTSLTVGLLGVPGIIMIILLKLLII